MNDATTIAPATEKEVVRVIHVCRLRNEYTAWAMTPRGRVDAYAVESDAAVGELMNWLCDIGMSVATDCKLIGY